MKKSQLLVALRRGACFAAICAVGIVQAQNCMIGSYQYSPSEHPGCAQRYRGWCSEDGKICEIASSKIKEYCECARQGLAEAEKAQREAEVQGALHDLRMQSIQSGAKATEERLVAAYEASDAIDQTYAGESSSLVAMLDKMKADAAVAAAKAEEIKQAINGEQRVVRGDVGNVIENVKHGFGKSKEVLEAVAEKVTGHEAEPSAAYLISEALTESAINRLGKQASDGLNQFDKAFAQAGSVTGESENPTTAAATAPAYSGGMADLTGTEIFLDAENHIGANTALEGVASEPDRQQQAGQRDAGDLASAHSQPSEGGLDIGAWQDDSTRRDPQVVAYNPQPVPTRFGITGGVVGTIAGQVPGESARGVVQTQVAVNPCAAADLAQLSADLPTGASASLRQLLHRLDAAISDVKAHCTNASDYPLLLQRLSDARMQAKKACDAITTPSCD